MMIRRGMKRSLLLILILNACCVFSQSKSEFKLDYLVLVRWIFYAIPFYQFIYIFLVSIYCFLAAHDALYLVGCFENGTTEVQFELDSEEVFYVNFEREEVVYTMPKFVVEDPTQILEIHHLYRNAARAKGLCPVAEVFLKTEEKNPPEERGKLTSTFISVVMWLIKWWWRILLAFWPIKDPPESILYPAEGLQLGDENTLICFVNHFYPPDIRVSWTKNGDPVSEGVSLSRYFLNKDQTFHQFSTLTFTPREGDIYSCTVEHLALDRPLTRIWGDCFMLRRHYNTMICCKGYPWICNDAFLSSTEPEFTHPSHVPEIFCGVGLTLGLLGVAAGTVLLVKGHHEQ